MLSKSNKTKTIFGCPQLKLTVITSCGQVGTLRRISYCIQIKMVALLLHNICFRLPLPNEKLTLLFRAKSNPLAI